MENAVLLKWDNIYYEKPSTRTKAIKKIIRLGLVQWQMRSYKNVQDLMQQIEYFIDALSGYKSDFALLPEFFNAPLMGLENHQNSIDSIKALAAHSVEIVEAIAKLAVSYNINIIAGSIPILENDDFKEIEISPTLWTDHFPNRVCFELERVAARFGRDENIETAASIV